VIWWGGAITGELVSPTVDPVGPVAEGRLER
jgi:hypothetical protein